MVLSLLNLPPYVQQVPLLVLSSSFSLQLSFVFFVIVLVFLQRREDGIVCPKLPSLLQFPPFSLTSRGSVVSYCDTPCPEFETGEGRGMDETELMCVQLFSFS